MGRGTGGGEGGEDVVCGGGVGVGAGNVGEAREGVQVAGDGGVVGDGEEEGAVGGFGEERERQGEEREGGGDGY